MTSYPPRVALVGLRGSGKTTLGKELALKLDLPFHDADQVLQEIEGRSIAQIFAEKGQDWFREREAQCLARLAQEERWVIACGGGAVLREENRSLLKKRAFVIWLDADPEILAGRILLDPQTKATRPALIASAAAQDRGRSAQDRTLEEITREMAVLAEQRQGLYQAVAHFRLDTGSGTSADWIGDLLKSWKEPGNPSALVEAAGK